MTAPDEALVAHWTEEQLRQASLARFNDDSDLPFTIHAAPARLFPPVHPLAPGVCREDLGALSVDGLHTVGGLDISFRDRSGDEGIAVLAVLSFPDLKLVASVSRTVSLASTPYVHSFLSFREAHFFVELVEELRTSRPDLPTPQLIFVDGNGRWHPRQAGSAVATGVATELPTVGIAKEYHPLHTPAEDASPAPCSTSGDAPLPFPPEFMTSQRAMRAACQALLRQRGDWIGLSPPSSSEHWGAALLSSPSRNAQNPIFVSPGHRLSLASCVRLALACTREGKIPEPVRVADRLGREEARRLWPKG
ncbi:endonuclease V-domain-containing protein [Rhodotorula diobovata]|uniref:Endonuclease V-domain-containing protein n=1 Tax=Rhodotorula diobovata TaxID=5288 RepID=A0A5C5FTR0_9BASI|nr:endonuclease V-domain-containing protein [Rhodotorula diobovata]